MSFGEHERVTQIQSNTLNPSWDEQFVFDLDASCENLVFTVHAPYKSLLIDRILLRNGEG
jgi:hypothetical protein